mmetsp:Transcript_42933/g.69660  ORF Transcript_42933/g.69660 Transcript_42933/m.69660 type:complete len:149 (+) Transcript_42933:885-1331(+)
MYGLYFFAYASCRVCIKVVLSNTLCCFCFCSWTIEHCRKGVLSVLKIMPPSEEGTIGSSLVQSSSIDSLSSLSDSSDADFERTRQSFEKPENTELRNFWSLCPSTTVYRDALSMSSLRTSLSPLYAQQHPQQHVPAIVTATSSSQIHS